MDEQEPPSTSGDHESVSQSSITEDDRVDVSQNPPTEGDYTSVSQCSTTEDNHAGVSQSSATEGDHAGDSLSSETNNESQEHVNPEVPVENAPAVQKRTERNRKCKGKAIENIRAQIGQKEKVASKKPPAARIQSDFSILRPALDNTSFTRLIKIFKDGTTEVRTLVETEFAVLMECKVCRNVFRGIEQLITHKRLFCTQASNLLLPAPAGSSGEALVATDVDVFPGSDLRRRLKEVKCKSARATCRKDLTTVIKKMLAAIMSPEEPILEVGPTDDVNTDQAFRQTLFRMADQSRSLAPQGQAPPTGANQQLRNKNGLPESGDTQQSEHYTMKFGCPLCESCLSTRRGVRRHLETVHKKTHPNVTRYLSKIVTIMVRNDDIKPTRNAARQKKVAQENENLMGPQSTSQPVVAQNPIDAIISNVSSATNSSNSSGQRPSFSTTPEFSYFDALDARGWGNGSDLLNYPPDLLDSIHKIVDLKVALLEEKIYADLEKSGVPIKWSPRNRPNEAGHPTSSNKEAGQAEKISWHELQSSVSDYYGEKLTRLPERLMDDSQPSVLDICRAKSTRLFEKVTDDSQPSVSDVCRAKSTRLFEKVRDDSQPSISDVCKEKSKRIPERANRGKSCFVDKADMRKDVFVEKIEDNDKTTKRRAKRTNSMNEMTSQRVFSMDDRTHAEPPPPGNSNNSSPKTIQVRMNYLKVGENHIIREERTADNEDDIVILSPRPRLTTSEAQYYNGESQIEKNRQSGCYNLRSVKMESQSGSDVSPYEKTQLDSGSYDLRSVKNDSESAWREFRSLESEITRETSEPRSNDDELDTVAYDTKKKHCVAANREDIQSASASDGTESRNNAAKTIRQSTRKKRLSTANQETLLKEFAPQTDETLRENVDRDTTVKNIKKRRLSVFNRDERENICLPETSETSTRTYSLRRRKTVEQDDFKSDFADDFFVADDSNNKSKFGERYVNSGVDFSEETDECMTEELLIQMCETPSVSKFSEELECEKPAPCSPVESEYKFEFEKDCSNSIAEILPIDESIDEISLMECEYDSPPDVEPILPEKVAPPKATPFTTKEARNLIYPASYEEQTIADVSVSNMDFEIPMIRPTQQISRPIPENALMDDMFPISANLGDGAPVGISKGVKLQQFPESGMDSNASDGNFGRKMSLTASVGNVKARRGIENVALFLKGKMGSVGSKIKGKGKNAPAPVRKSSRTAASRSCPGTVKIIKMKADTAKISDSAVCSKNDRKPIDKPSENLIEIKPKRTIRTSLNTRISTYKEPTPSKFVKDITQIDSNYVKLRAQTLEGLKPKIKTNLNLDLSRYCESNPDHAIIKVVKGNERGNVQANVGPNESKARINYRIKNILKKDSHVPEKNAHCADNAKEEVSDAAIKTDQIVNEANVKTYSRSRRRSSKADSLTDKAIATKNVAENEASGYRYKKMPQEFVKKDLRVDLTAVSDIANIKITSGNFERVGHNSRLEPESQQNEQNDKASLKTYFKLDSPVENVRAEAKGNQITSSQLQNESVDIDIDVDTNYDSDDSLRSDDLEKLKHYKCFQPSVNLSPINCEQFNMAKNDDAKKRAKKNDAPSTIVPLEDTSSTTKDNCGVSRKRKTDTGEVMISPKISLFPIELVVDLNDIKSQNSARPSTSKAATAQRNIVFRVPPEDRPQPVSVADDSGHDIASANRNSHSTRNANVDEPAQNSSSPIKIIRYNGKAKSSPTSVQVKHPPNTPEKVLKQDVNGKTTPEEVGVLPANSAAVNGGRKDDGGVAASECSDEGKWKKRRAWERKLFEDASAGRNA